MLNTVAEEAGMGWAVVELRASLREAGMTLEGQIYEMDFKG